MIYHIKNKENNKPREKAKNSGFKNLSDTDLLSILLGSGNKTNPVSTLSKKILLELDQDIKNINLKKLTSINGIGIAKASIICASFELSRRFLCPAKKKIIHPRDVIPYIIHYGDREQEHFIAISLNGANEIIKVKVITIGLLNKTMVHPREVFSDLLKSKAAALIIAHNHPSGNVKPSKEDINITLRLQEVGELMGIPLLDHIIFNDHNYYSFIESKQL